MYVAEEVTFLLYYQNEYFSLCNFQMLTCFAIFSISLDVFLFYSSVDFINYSLVQMSGQVRGVLAQLGYEKLDDIIGRTDLLKPRHISLTKTQHLDLSYLLSVRN